MRGHGQLPVAVSYAQVLTWSNDTDFQWEVGATVVRPDGVSETIVMPARDPRGCCVSSLMTQAAIRGKALLTGKGTTPLSAICHKNAAGAGLASSLRTWRTRRV